jgi:hypothetical protein
LRRCASRQHGEHQAEGNAQSMGNDVTLQHRDGLSEQFIQRPNACVRVLQQASCAPGKWLAVG